MRGADYRAVGAAAYLGVGSVWALGLSSSAALIMAAPASLPAVDSANQRRHSARPDARPVAKRRDRAALILALSMRDLLLLRAPSPMQARSMADMGVDVRSRDRARSAEPADARRVARVQPAADDLRRRAAASAIWRARWPPKGASDHSRSQPLRLRLPDRGAAAALAAAIVHEGHLGRRCRRSAGVLIQYPLYAGHGEDDDRVGAGQEAWREFFIDVSTPHTFPLLVGVYSAFLGLFIPSAGGKWLVEAPYMLDGRQLAPGASGMGGADLQRDRGAGQPHSSVLDAAARWGSSASRPATSSATRCCSSSSTCRSCCFLCGF